MRHFFPVHLCVCVCLCVCVYARVCVIEREGDCLIVMIIMIDVTCEEVEVKACSYYYELLDVRTIQLNKNKETIAMNRVNKKQWIEMNSTGWLRHCVVVTTWQSKNCFYCFLFSF